MEVREATSADAAEVLAFVRAKAAFDRGLGAFTGDLGTGRTGPPESPPNRVFANLVDITK